MKKRILIPIAILLVALVVSAIYINPLLPIITGYAAKNLASGVFVSHRTQQEMEDEDLNFSFIRFTRNKIDYKQKTVTSSFLWGKSKAIYIDDFGCTLLNDFSEEEVLARPYPSWNYPAYDANNVFWPMGNILEDSIPSGIDQNRLSAITEDIFSDNPLYRGTFGFMAVYQGQIIAERYRSDFSMHTRFLSWSMAKSITNALVGVRVREGKLDKREPLAIEGVAKEITLNDLLHMNSGLEWNENYGNQSDVTLMLHTVGDMGRYTWNRSEKYQAGQHWYYSSGSTNAACLALRQSFDNDTDYWRFPKDWLFDKIGMQSAVFELDASGTFVGSSYVYATLRDYARFGLLYLREGEWLGEQILPKKWVNYTKMVAEGSDGKYGSSFWLNADGSMPDTPTDALLCKGHDGQFIVILPSQDLVLVRTGYSPKGKFDLNQMIKQVLTCLPK
ncbi:MAG: serine hydrolase domain-containing protein [Mangrovibacterium sp.]